MPGYADPGFDTLSLHAGARVSIDPETRLKGLRQIKEKFGGVYDLAGLERRHVRQMILHSAYSSAVLK